MVGRGQRALEQLGRDDVGRSALGQLPDGDRVAPGALVVLRQQEVERQQGCEVDGAFAGAALQHAAHAAVDLAPAAEREALVRNCAEEVVPEAQHVRPLPGDELAEAAPAVEVADVLELVREHVGQQVELEAGPEHGGVAEQEAIAGLEGVDPSRDQRLDGLRERRAVAAGAGGRHELAHEQRVSTRALRDFGNQVFGERDLAGGRKCQLRRLVAVEC